MSWHVASSTFKPATVCHMPLVIQSYECPSATRRENSLLLIGPMGLGEAHPDKPTKVSGAIEKSIIPGVISHHLSAAGDYSSGLWGAKCRILPTTVITLGTEAQRFPGSVKSISKDTRE